ncbi:conserved Plasmodium protein, unknown function [Plasmodium relictum]|uniref:Uncharacterized protein n=1 Tax=Plasmodium relictum TaxID=85471 RepID=A0A1J1HDY9_PLARL|nr:conserved Plasmodium protein, unknown function [Plasmodium relictum]CRH01638.1 conserved Plasmodium protein, unknown function [Plasmodium relictum]
MDILNKRKKKKIFSEEESDSDSENVLNKINNKEVLENQPFSDFNEVNENKNILNNKYLNENNLLDENTSEENKEVKKKSDSNEYDNNKIESCEYQDNGDQSNSVEYNLKEKKKKKKLKKNYFQENSIGDSEDLMETKKKECKFDKKNFIVKNKKSNNTFIKKNTVKTDMDNEFKSNEIVNEKHEFDEENNKKENCTKVKKSENNDQNIGNNYESKDKDNNYEDENEDKNYESENDEKNFESENEDKSHENENNEELGYFEKKKKKRRIQNDAANSDIDVQYEKENKHEVKDTLKEKKKRTKNSKLMDHINPDEDKLKLKLIQISFSKKEYNIEEFIYECLKVIVPLNKREIFLSNENIIFEHINREDLKKLEILWFNNLTKNRQKSIICCFNTLNKLNNEHNRIINDTNKEESLNSENNLCEENKNNSLPCNIFDKNKETIIIDYLVELCNQQVKLIKEYISYIKKHIYDLSSIVENNQRIKEMKIVDPMKRRELFFYLNICISMNYVQENSPNIYSISSNINPDIRGFNLHPMFSHINKKKEQKSENAINPWEKLKLLKKGKKNDTINKNEYIKKKEDIMFENEADEKEKENKDTEKEERYLGEIEHIEKKELEEIEKKKKALEEIEKKKKERADKKTFNVYSLLESAAQFFGEGPKYSNPNIQEFHKSNNNQLVYIKPPDNIDEKNILINFFLQFPSTNKKLEYNKRRIYAENYGLIKIIKNNENLPINFELNTQPWELEEYKNLWNEQNKLNNFQIWNMSNVLNYDNLSEYTYSSNTKTEQVNQNENSKGEINKDKYMKNELNKDESTKNELNKDESTKNEMNKDENKKNEMNKDESTKNEMNKDENKKNEMNKDENKKNEMNKDESTKNELNKDKNMKNESMIASNIELKKTGSRKSEILTRKIKKIFCTDDSKQLKLTSFLSKDKINESLKNENEIKTNVELKEEISNKSTSITIENEDVEYITIKKKRKKVLDDAQINSEYNTNNLNDSTENNMRNKTNKNKEEENNNEDKKKIYEEFIKREKFKEEKKRLLNDKVKEIFELEAEESEDENIEDPEERRKAQLLKKQKCEENDIEDDEEYNSEDFSAFINNEECNSDNDIVKLKHVEEMEKLEEDIFLKKFTYQGKEFNKELTNKEKLELEREKQLLRKKKLLLNCNLGNVKLSDFESDSSSSSNEPFKNSLYEDYTEFDNVDKIKKDKNSLEYSYNDNVFKKGEYISEVMDEKKKKQILKKIDDVIYRKEVNTNEGKKIVIKKKRKIRFHQDLSDITVTEEEKLDEYEKTKKKHKKVKSNVVETSSSLNIPSKVVNHSNKASIKWNNNIKDISELDTPTNGEIFKGFRKTENLQ